MRRRRRRSIEELGVGGKEEGEVEAVEREWDKRKTKINEKRKIKIMNNKKRPRWKKMSRESKMKFGGRCKHKGKIEEWEEMSVVNKKEGA